MTFVKNANQIAEQILKRDNVVSAYKTLLEGSQHNYRHKFVQALQVYVLKIGLALCDCIPGAKLTHDTYLGSIDFICNKVLRNKQLYNVMRAIEVNEGGNTMKHSIEDIDNINIGYIVNEYNTFISEIVKNTKLTAFKKCYITKAKSERDIPIAEDAKHHKYFTIKNLKFQLKISPDYTVDQYSKKLTSKITLYWPDGNPGWFADVEIKNTHNNRMMGGVEKLDLSKANNKHAFTLTCGENDLDRRVLYLSVKITLFKQKKSTYTTGILFWKEEHTNVYFEQITSQTEKISQFFKAH